VTKPGSPAWLKARGIVWTWWTPGEPDGDLHGFWSARERDAYDRGAPGPFRRIVRNHHSLGPVPDEIKEARRITDKWQSRS
jgi:hypothetical protein